MKYGYWRTDKPREPGFSYEFISADTELMMKECKGATIDNLYGIEIEGVDTILKAF